MLTMILIPPYNWIWQNEYAPKRWRKGVVGSLFKKGNKPDPGELPRDNAINPFRAPEPLPILNPRNFVPKNGFPVVKGLRTLAKSFSKISNDELGTMLGKDEKISERASRIQAKQTVVAYTCGRYSLLGKMVQDRKDAGLTTYCFSLDVKKA